MLKEIVLKELKKISELKKIKLDINDLEIPPESEMGDVSLPCYKLSLFLKKNPKIISEELEKLIKPNKAIMKVKSLNIYLNFYLRPEYLAKKILTHKLKKKKLKKEIVVLESPGPNTNKALHIGHLRNMLLGNSLKNLYKEVGYKIFRVDIINDRGVHINKSMLTYKKFANNKKPDKKPDHFIGEYYMKYEKEEQKNPGLKQELQEMLKKWEEKDKKIRALWKKLRNWCIQGLEESYEKYGVKIDKTYYESDHYEKAKKIVQKGVEEGVFKKDEKGNTIYKIDEKSSSVVLRPDNTTLYLTQDIYLAKLRYDDYKMNRMIYVVSNEQEYHFKILFKILKSLKYSFADNCYHLSYGHVFLPSGKMSSRLGNVILVDELLTEIKDLSKKELLIRNQKISEKELNEKSEIIAMGAIKFSMLKIDSEKKIVFNKKTITSFEGETGPYLQYTYARIQSVIRKSKIKKNNINYNLLNSEIDKKLLKKIQEQNSVIIESLKKHKPNILAKYLILLAQTINEYYSKNRILQENEELEITRIQLVKKANQTLKKGINLLGFKTLERM